MVSREVELSKYDIQYVPRESIKSQALVEFSFLVDEEMPLEWELFVDGTSNVKEAALG